MTIEIHRQVGDTARVFKFNPMTPEQAALWASRVRARLTLREGLTQQVKMVGEVPDERRDQGHDDRYLALSERLMKANLELTKVALELAAACVDPGPQTIKTLFESNNEDDAKLVTDILLEYLGGLLPGEGDRKK